MELIQTGKIVNIHGIKGEVKVQPWSDSPEDLLYFEEIWIDGQKHNVLNARIQKSCVLMKIEGVDTPEDAEKLRNKVIFVDKEDFELEEGTYFWDDLMGLEAKNAQTGESYGKVTDILQTGANDVYEITMTDGKKIYIPAIADSDINVDLEGGVMTFIPLKGLFDI
jgi:16S rRNA processing protein RimM